MSQQESLSNKTLNGFIWSGIGTVVKSVLQLDNIKEFELFL